jgi:hypothetical protein
MDAENMNIAKGMPSFLLNIDGSPFKTLIISTHPPHRVSLES